MYRTTFSKIKTTWRNIFQLQSRMVANILLVLFGHRLNLHKEQNASTNIVSSLKNFVEGPQSRFLSAVLPKAHITHVAFVRQYPTMTSGH